VIANLGDKHIGAARGLSRIYKKLDENQTKQTLLADPHVPEHRQVLLSVFILGLTINVRALQHLSKPTPSTVVSLGISSHLISSHLISSHLISSHLSRQTIVARRGRHRTRGTYGHVRGAARVALPQYQLCWDW